MNVSKVFAFGEVVVRVLGTQEKPLFVAADICRVLELQNPSKALADFSENEKGITRGYTLGGEQEMLVVTEPGLYRLVFRSEKPAAKIFQDWVFQDVLPAIRKTGSYGSREEELRDMYARAKSGVVQMEILRMMNQPATGDVAPANSAQASSIMEEIMALQKSGTIPKEAFRIEERFVKYAMGAPNQEWTSCAIFMNPVMIMAGMPERDWPKVRETLSVQPYWMGKIKKRFGKPGSMVSCNAWGINLDFHPLGYRPCSDLEYQNYKESPGAVDPRRGPLFELVELVKI